MNADIEPLILGPGKIVSAEFSDGKRNAPVSGCGSCECPHHGCEVDDNPKPAGVYVTIRLDAPKATVAFRRVVVTEEAVQS